MNRMLRLALLLALPALVALQAIRPAAAQPSRDSIGVAPDGQNAIEFIGRSQQDGDVVTHFGYVTHLFGLPDEELFSSRLQRTEATARFTFFATTRIDSRHVVGSIISTSAVGTLTFYLTTTPSAQFDNPASFTRGTPVAVFTIRHHGILNVQMPNQGILSAVADLSQTSSAGFSFLGRRRRLGFLGSRQRLWATGPGTLTQAEPPRASYTLGGYIAAGR